MTSASFNTVSLQTTTVQANQPLTLKQGQVFHGTIKKLYPNQMAEVQVGGNKLIAKLETPLKVGDAHFFQVTNTSAAETELKVVTAPMSQGMTTAQQMGQLLESMNLPKSSEMQQIMAHFMKQQIPISKEQLIQAEMWMKSLPEGVTKQDALNAMQRMVELKMPFTTNVFQALVQGAKTDGISQTLQNFIQQLGHATTVNEHLKSSIMQQIELLSKPFDAETGGLILSRAVQLLSDSNVNSTDKMQILQLLKQAGVVPQNATLQNWANLQQNQNQQVQMQPFTAGQLTAFMAQATPQQSAQMIQQVQAFIANDRLLTAEQKTQLQQLADRFTQLPQNKQAIEIFTKQFQAQLLKAYSDNSADRMFTTNHEGLSTKDQILSLLNSKLVWQNNESLLRGIVKEAANSSHATVQSMLTQADAQVQSSIDSKAMEQAIKTVLKGLGVSYEATLNNNKATDMQAVAQQLKPQLLALIHDSSTSSALRDSAELLMARMNGMQLLSGENGHQHQLVMQVPLDFFGKRFDATLQWNGRMKEDGKIDANYARVLFYLQMESLNETVIDMQVQNRIVTVTVFNENTDLTQLADPLKQSLKNGLADKKYQLSGVFIKQFEKNEVKATQELKEDHDDYSGVDFRV